jgi:hypothetical protein
MPARPQAAGKPEPRSPRPLGAPSSADRPLHLELDQPIQLKRVLHRQLGTVKVGLPTRLRLVFVPLDQATVGPGYLKVCYDKKQVKDAPSIGTDGELPAGDEEAIFKHYGLTYEPGASGERRLARR